MHNNFSNQTTGVLVSLYSKSINTVEIEDLQIEMTFLSKTMGIKICESFIQKMERPDTKTFVGKGKLSDIQNYCKENKIQVVVVDNELSPSQLRNLENLLKIKIYDRSLLILDIFLKRARTAQAKIQVELARLQYLLPRLTRMWTHLERQRGGTGTRGGSGEKEIETDRRAIRNQISVLSTRLKKAEKQASTQRKSRGDIVRVAIVGYTNAGKSSLMRLLSKETVYVKNELFATLDTTVRKVVINNLPFLLSDTVGFIRKLPHQLIEAFKSTLSEVTEADIILHVTDVSSSSHVQHMEVVDAILQELGTADKKVITVYNKSDKVEPSIDLSDNDVLMMSCHTKEGLDNFKKHLYKEVKKVHRKIYPNYLASDVD